MKREDIVSALSVGQFRGQRARSLGIRRVMVLAAMLLSMTAGGCKKNPPNPETAPSSAAASSATASSPDGGASAPSGQPDQALGQDQQGSLAQRLSAVQSGAADDGGKPALPDWKAMPAGASGPTIPLVKGLVVVTAIAGAEGDYESIKSIQDASPKTVSIAYSADNPTPKMTGLLGGAEAGRADPKNEFPPHTSCTRLVDVVDLAMAHSYSEFFCASQGSAEHFPGSTAIGSSADMIHQLRAGQQVKFHFSPQNKFAQFMQLGEVASGQKPTGPVLSQHAGQPMYSCNLHRVEATDLAAPVLVNGQRASLPALHAMCALEGNEEADVYYLDDPSNPLTLAFQLGPVDSRLQAIEITFPLPEAQKPNAAGNGSDGSGGGGGGGGSQMEAALAAKKPFQVYGIYFDFNSSKIKPESEPVLRQIAAIMRKNPDWKLSVSGHTDNIGGDTFNLGLSQRRAAAVKDALVTRYHIAPDRLATSGYGASDPIDTNKTMEGRARNRRVELQRQ